jgi:hypothetical protein
MTVAVEGGKHERICRLIIRCPLSGLPGLKWLDRGGPDLDEVRLGERLAVVGGDMDGLGRLGAARGMDADAVGAGLIWPGRKRELVGLLGTVRDEQHRASEDRGGLGDLLPGGEVG